MKTEEEIRSMIKTIEPVRDMCGRGSIFYVYLEEQIGTLMWVLEE